MFKDLKSIFKDEGTLILAVLVPLLYPLVYSFIYTNETVTDMPVCAVDLSNTPESRQFIRAYDATPEVNVVYKSTNLSEAKQLMMEQKVHAVIYFPEDFAEHWMKMEQSPIQLYCDMGFILYYKAAYMTAMKVVLAQKSPLTAGNADPIKVHEVRAYNTIEGYGNFLLQAILPLIIQQTLLLALACEVGTRRQRGQKELSIKNHLKKGVAYLLLYTFHSGYLLVVVPRIFNFTQTITVGNLFAFMVPLLLSMVTFALFISLFFKRRETPFIYIAFTSIILLFLTGASWPEQAMPIFWQWVAWIFPSTPAVRAFMRLNAMGAELNMVAHYLWIMLLQAAVYFALFIAGKRVLAKRYPTEED